MSGLVPRPWPDGWRSAKPFNLLWLQIGYTRATTRNLRTGTNDEDVLGMARPEGFEPPTTWFEAKYSIQLSYGRMRTDGFA